MLTLWCGPDQTFSPTASDMLGTGLKHFLTNWILKKTSAAPVQNKLFCPNCPVIWGVYRCSLCQLFGIYDVKSGWLQRYCLSWSTATNERGINWWLNVPPSNGSQATWTTYRQTEISCFIVRCCLYNPLFWFKKVTVCMLKLQRGNWERVCAPNSASSPKFDAKSLSGQHDD